MVTIHSQECANLGYPNPKEQKGKKSPPFRCTAVTSDVACERALPLLVLRLKCDEGGMHFLPLPTDYDSAITNYALPLWAKSKH
jgi:hypothetical protein